MAKTTELEAAYSATTYRVFLPGGLCELRLDQVSASLCAWLKTAGATQFALLSAHNPGGERLDQATNMTRQSQMEVELLESGYEPYAGENEADSDWPVEETCFITDIGMPAAREIAAKYGQNAIVHGLADGIPRLVWID